MKLTVHYSKKAGLPEFGSECIGATLEIPLQEGSPEEVAAVFEAAQADLKRLVEAKLVGTGRTNGNGGNGHHAPRSNGGHEAKGIGNGNGHATERRSVETSGPRANGNGQHEESEGSLSPKQRNYLLGLSSKRGWRVARLNEELRNILGREGATLHSISRQEASLAIETLKAEPAA